MPKSVPQVATDSNIAICLKLFEGSVELAAVGISVSVFNLVSKLFNVPSLNITTSFVAAEHALNINDSNASGICFQDGEADIDGNMVLPSVSASLALAAGLGIAEAIALCWLRILMNTMVKKIVGYELARKAMDKKKETGYG